MSSERQLRLKTLALVVIGVAFANFGDLSLKRGMTQVGSVEFSLNGLWGVLTLTVTNFNVWMGIVFLIASTATTMTVLSWADYSYVMPVGAFGYAILTLLAVIFLGERVSVWRWIGVFFVSIGVFLVGWTKPRTTEEG
jgi:drug/metabolite transporter (DMT)-like permease